MFRKIFALLHTGKTGRKEAATSSAYNAPDEAVDLLRKEQGKQTGPIEPCFAALGFTRRPTSKEEVKQQYRRMAIRLHPDSGGDAKAFIALKENYEECIRRL